MPSELALKTMNFVHRSMMTISGGRFGWSVAKMPVIELTTTGRKSGQQRASMLTTPWTDGDRIGIIASAGGNDAHPAWYLNLEANPLVTVRSQGSTRQMTARIASGDERAKIWEAVSSEFTNYADYQAKTDREIPVVVLEPNP